MYACVCVHQHRPSGTQSRFDDSFGVENPCKCGFCCSLLAGCGLRDGRSVSVPCCAGRLLALMRPALRCHSLRPWRDLWGWQQHAAQSRQMQLQVGGRGGGSAATHVPSNSVHFCCCVCCGVNRSGRTLRLVTPSRSPLFLFSLSSLPVTPSPLSLCMPGWLLPVPLRVPPWAPHHLLLLLLTQ